MNDIIKAVNDKFGLDCLEKTRKQEYTYARCVGMYVAHRKMGLSVLSISKMFGFRCHGTAINAIKNKVESMWDWERAKFDKDVESVLNKINSQTCDSMIYNEFDAQYDEMRLEY